MKRKTIVKHLTTKLNNWLSTITDNQLAKDVKSNIVLSGGSIASMLTNTDINDYDIYIKSKVVLKRLIEYYINNYDCGDMILLDGALEYDIDDSNFDNGFSIAVKNLTKDRLKLYSSEGIYRKDILEIYKENNIIDSILPKTLYVPIVWTANAISLTNDIQIIIRFHGNPKEIHANYDFIHATNYFTFDEGLITNIEALEALLVKQLIYRGSKYPLTSIIRSKKFILRGYKISAGEYLKMAWQVSKLDLSNLYTLEEQLMGVDVAYFNIIIDILKTELEKDSKFKITSDWLFVIIDKVFNET